MLDAVGLAQFQDIMVLSNYQERVYHKVLKLVGEASWRRQQMQQANSLLLPTTLTIPTSLVELFCYIGKSGSFPLMLDKWIRPTIYLWIYVARFL